jgi:hypothetical protein
MEKQQLIDQTRDILSSFETQNVITFLKDLSHKSLIDNPLILGLLVVVLFFAFVRRSKVIILFIFIIVALFALVQYALPLAGDLTFTSYLPFAFGCLGVGAVLIYFIFIKTD